jgi:hypothetical protein
MKVNLSEPASAGQPDRGLVAKYLREIAAERIRSERIGPTDFSLAHTYPGARHQC